jgi:hypothetical protein
MTDGRRDSTPHSAGGLPQIIKQLSNQVMNTPRGLFLVAACCLLCGSAWFLLAYDFTARTDHPTWFRFAAIVLCLWMGVKLLQEGKRLWIRRGVLKRTGT